jgi:hypothetical protein
VPVSFDSITVLETFPQVDEECFAFEAEDFADQDLFAPLFVAEDPDACGGFYINTEDGGDQSVPEDSGRISIEFEVMKRATFVVWFRALAPSGTDDSYWVQMDDEDPFIFSIERDTAWLWDQVRGGGNDPHLFDLLPGTHTFHVIRRENGTLLDKIFITNQLALVPESCEVCETTSVKPFAGNPDSHIRFYPNPATGFINIESEISSRGILNIYNIMGKLVMSEKIESNTSVAIDYLNEGIYFFEFSSAEGRSVQKIVVQ